MKQTPPSERVRVRRLHERAHYDRAAINSVLDAGLVCHVGYVFDGAPYVTPTLYWRESDRVYWHGSAASRMLRAAEGAAVCLTVSHFDGLVLARSGFHSSVNYRSAMLFGIAEKVDGDDRKVAALEFFMEKILPGRWAALRPPTAQEIKATTVLTMPIDEASAKIRTGPPSDDEEDYGWPVWAGVVPLTTATGTPLPCPRQDPATPIPAHVADFRIG
jgi:nitroimidazol reductase NimA-like FMN-containing flavoprotein (pyridoxamine 5'-phosphate oxidase superfamily)